MRLSRFARSPWSLALCGLFAGPLAAAEVGLDIEIPRLAVAEYHRPYVAAWIERADRSVAANLSLWYQLPKPGEAERNAEGGGKWLPDLRQWWRRTGRELQLPADGISGATRVAGVHELRFTPGTAPFPELPAGRYRLVVEAAREEGGRELLEIPFDWPATGATTLSARGERELGALRLTLKP